MRKKLPIGIDDFEEILTENFYYIDKTGFISELLHHWGKVNLFTRPRRFGKSLNMSMLKSFFEIGCDTSLFEGLDISKEPELCQTYMGKFPVIFISLKGVDGGNFETARMMLAEELRREAERFQFLSVSGNLTAYEKQKYLSLLDLEDGFRQWPDYVLMGSLQLLSELLFKHYGKKVILLIDEYDVPLAKAFENGYYDEMAPLIRTLFGQTFKTNTSLYFAVLTGCLRVAKESIFTGLNNLRILSMTDVRFDEYFGFTRAEVKDLLDYYGLGEWETVVKDWYDGYHFGSMDVYCPWDVVCYCDDLSANPKAQPKDYWTNTSSNDIVRRLIEKADAQAVKRDIERLIAGEAIKKEIRQDLVYKELYASIENIWSVLFAAGYLTQQGEAEGDDIWLAIPNLEIRRIFTRQIMDLFYETIREEGAATKAFCEAFKNGDVSQIENRFQAYLRKTISIRDTFVQKGGKESFYHGILLGLLGYQDSWNVSSNQEAGAGYSDILVEIEEESLGIIVELKYAQSGNLQAGCEEALAQIKQKHYEDALKKEGISKIQTYGIACWQKQCKVMALD